MFLPLCETPRVAIADYRDNIEPVLRPALGDDPLLAASPLVKDPGATEDVSIADELKNLLDPLSHPGALIQRAAFGRALAGSPDSVAGRLFHAVDETFAPTLAITNAGIVIFNVTTEPRGQGLLRRWFGAVDQVAARVHRVPRSAVVGAKPAPQGVLRRGRFLLAFTDGSGCALVCSPPSLMEQVVGAL
jgi:hypothetical protein